MRKEAGFEITDRICIYYNNVEGKTKTVLEAGAFKDDVLAVCVCEGTADGYTKQVDINGEKATLTVVKSV